MRAEDCKSTDDVVQHLASELKWIDEEVKVGTWVQKMGFRRSFVISQVWYNNDTKKWAFHVSDDEYSGEPNMGSYQSFTDLLSGVAQKYASLWKLES
jgi:hypothetical protein